MLTNNNNNRSSNSTNSAWSSSGALSSFTLGGLVPNSRAKYRSSAKSNSNENLLQEFAGESSRTMSSPSSSSKARPGYDVSEQTFALNFKVESCMDSDNEEDDDEETKKPLKDGEGGEEKPEVDDRKRGSFLQPPGHEPWWNWDNIGDLHPAHTRPLFYTVQEETETIQSVAAKFKITPSEVKCLNRLSEDFIFVGQKLRIRN